MFTPRQQQSCIYDVYITTKGKIELNAIVYARMNGLKNKPKIYILWLKLDLQSRAKKNSSYNYEPNCFEAYS